jgi:hypothetical protein
MAERLIGDRRTSDSSPTEERNHPIPPPTKTYRPASPLLGSTSGPRSQPACRSWANPDGRSGSKAAQRPTQTAIRAHQDKWQQAGVSASWVAGDEIYGTDPGCGPSCRPARSAMCWRSPATTGSAGVASPAGSRGRSGGSRPGRGRAWQGGSAGAGAKGHRLSDWAFTRLDHDGPPPADQAGRH